MKLAVLLVSAALSLSLSLSFQDKDKAKPEWKYLFSLEDDRDTFETYYDAASIERSQQGIVRVWLKQIPVTPNAAERQRIVSAIIRNRKLNKMSTDGYEKYAYTLTLFEFDCSGRKGRGVSIKDYDEAEKLLGSDTKEGSSFAPVLEGSSSEVILKAVCK
jgi:surface-adhesin protein E